MCVPSNDQRPKLVQINGVEIEGLVDRGADIRLFSQMAWNTGWPLQKVYI